MLHRRTPRAAAAVLFFEYRIESRRREGLLLDLASPLAKRPISKITPLGILVLLQKHEKAALYWSAVVNGVLAAPIMVVLMILVRQPKVMGRFVVGEWLYGLGWASTAAMALCIVGMGVGLFGG